LTTLKIERDRLVCYPFPEITDEPNLTGQTQTLTPWFDSHTKPAGNGYVTSQPLNGNARKRRVTV
jgi:hypothetical protein